MNEYPIAKARADALFPRSRSSRGCANNGICLPRKRNPLPASSSSCANRKVNMNAFLKRLWSRHQAFLIVSFVAILCLWVIPAVAKAQSAPAGPSVPIPQFNIGVGQAKNPKDVASALQILLLLTVLALAPAVGL